MDCCTELFQELDVIQEKFTNLNCGINVKNTKFLSPVFLNSAEEKVNE